MIYRVITQPSAEAGADEAFRWLYEHSPEAAARWYRGLRQAIESLAEYPQRCPLAPENRYFGEEIRHLLYGRRRGVYRILFTIQDDTVSVLYVRHSAQDVLREHPGSEEETNGASSR